jgi:hypothetical protein
MINTVVRCFYRDQSFCGYQNNDLNFVKPDKLFTGAYKSIKRSAFFLS